MINAEISDSGAQQNKPEFKVLGKDLEEAKERWMELEDWGDDDMMQHPIDEGLRRVSFSFSCIVLMMTNLISIFDAYRHIVNLAKSVPIHVIVVPVAVNWIVRLNFVPVNQKQM